MISEIERERFRRICLDVLSQKSGEDGGIGTLNEKRLHIALKRFVCPDETKYEVEMGGRIVADVFFDDEIFEIQTGSLYPLSKKLEYYINNTPYHITVVHPIAKKRTKIWIDPETGVAGEPVRSPRGETLSDGASELIYISDYLCSGRVSVWFLLIEEEEYRFLDGRGRDKKRHSSRFERLPVDILDEVVLAERVDYFALLPDSLPESFTAEEYRRAAKRARGRRVYMALGALERVGVIEPDGNRGRAKRWRRVKEKI